MILAALDSKRQCNSFVSAVGVDKATEGLNCTGYSRIFLDEYLELGSRRNNDLRCVALDFRFGML